MFEVDDPSPAEATVAQGDGVEVSATVTNTGDASGTQDIEFRVDENVLATDSLSLDAGGSASVSATLDTSDLDVGEYTHAVASADDEQTGTLTLVSAPAAYGDIEAFQTAAERGPDARDALATCEAFVEGWLAYQDEETRLIPDEIDQSAWWPEDAAADNWPFMVITSWITNEQRFENEMKLMLGSEQARTNRLDPPLAAPYDLNANDYLFADPDLENLIFGSMEYVKDGLMPITNLLVADGNAWTNRLLELMDSIWEHASVETDFGMVPADDVEVNGEMLQISSRIYWMTGEEVHLDRATRLADWFLLGGNHPTDDFDSLRLSDHGAEIISGLTEVYATVHHARPDKAEEYREPIHRMLDRILEVGVDDDGMMHVRIDPQNGTVLNDSIIDTWGYNYNGYYTVYLLDEKEEYRDAVVHALENIDAYRERSNEWADTSADGLADSAESAINLYNREAIEGVPEWMDAMAQDMMDSQQSDGIFEGWHGDGNVARTLTMYALYKQQGVRLSPWREDVLVGSVSDSETLYVHVESAQDYEGTLVLDTPRHDHHMNMPLDYPRINQYPEWFTLTPEQSFTYTRHEQGGEATVHAHEGTELPISIPGGTPVGFVIEPDSIE
jgi:hypothetical protein